MKVKIKTVIPLSRKISFEAGGNVAAQFATYGVTYHRGGKKWDLFVDSTFRFHKIVELVRSYGQQ
jgi:hypothetical protein